MHFHASNMNYVKWLKQNPGKWLKNMERGSRIKADEKG